MNIFLTGATGFIGGSVGARLVSAGHQVRGLVRTDKKATQIEALGIVPIRGDLDQTDVLVRESQRADAVINAANSDHRASVEAIIQGLKGSQKPFIHTSGCSIVADNALGQTASDNVIGDDTPFTPVAQKAGRVAIDGLVRDAASSGVRSTVLCNTMVYGHGSGLHRDSVQIPLLMAQARKSGVVRYVGKGANIWSNVHIEDVVDLYVLALMNTLPGSFYFVENGEASFREIAEAVANRMQFPEPEPWTIEEAAAEWGFSTAAYTLGSNCRVRSKRARADLKWSPRHLSVINWISRDA